MRTRGWMRVAIVVILVAVVALWLPGRAPVATSHDGPTIEAISYNPPPAQWVHAPLSSMGLVGLTDATPAAITSSGGLGLDGAIYGSSSITVSATRFIDDQSYMPQSETTVAVDPSNTDHIVSGVNDARWFFCGALPASDCPSGYQISISGFTVSADGGSTVMKSGDIPGLLYVSPVNKHFVGFLASWGDPSVAATVDGNFYYASLAIDPVTGNNGIELAVSNSELWNASQSCATPSSAPWTNPCWTGTFVYGNLTGTQVRHLVHAVSSFEDKELIAVDRDSSSSYYGDVYIAWDHFFADGSSSTYLARCTQSLSCTMLSGGAQPVVSGSDPYVAFSTPVVGSDGSVYVSWCNYGTATTYGPVTCRDTSSSAGGTAFGTPNTILAFDGAGALANDTGLVGFATEQFRTDSLPVIAVDTSGVSNNLYFTIAVCTSGNYYGFDSPALPGNCGDSGVVVASSTDGGATWSTPQIISTNAVNFQPWVTVDPSNGNVVVTYYTTQYDAFNHRVDVVAQVSTDQGSTFTEQRLTNVSDEPNADPVLFNYFAQFGGAFVVPQFGDYQQAVAIGGTIYEVFTGNYAEELGTFQADPFLATATE